MKIFNKKREIIYLILIIFLGYNFLINFYLKNFLYSNNIKINYLFCITFIPDKITFINLKYDNVECLFLTVDLYVYNLLKKKFDRCIEGLSFSDLNFKILYNQKKEKKDDNINEIVFPFLHKISIKNSRITFFDEIGNQKLVIKNITGESKLNRAKYESEKYLVLDLFSDLNGKNNQKILLKLLYYPYYKNKFFLNIFASKIDTKEFQPIFLEKNILIEDGKLNFIIQIKGEMDKIYVNNIMQFNNLKLKENIDNDIKEVFGLSLKQIIDFLKDSQGDFFINFDFVLNRKEFHKILKVYSDKFTDSIKNRIILGVVTAPIRQVKDLIWNITGENILKIIKIFNGE